MLRKLSEEIRECYRHATEARQRADAANDPFTKEDFLDVERRWLFLARSYEFSERLTLFTSQRHSQREQKKLAD